MKISVASDHAAYERKKEVVQYLKEKGHEVIDFGTDSSASVDYPDYIEPACEAVARHDVERGVMLCGSGIGASIVANKVKGIRAALCMDEYSAEYSRRHNDANVLVLAGRRRTMDDISRYLDIWLGTEYEGGRHQNRVDKISAIDNKG